MGRHVVSVTADIVVLNQRMQPLVIKRKNPPFQNGWALPGGYVDEGETFLQAAVRELLEETGLRVLPHRLLPLSIRDHPLRDPRGRVISQPYLTRVDGVDLDALQAGDDALEYTWWDRREALAFDHDEIVREAWTRNEVWTL